MIGLGGDPNKIQYDGHYEDIYVKTPQGWRFKQRTHYALLSGGRAHPRPRNRRRSSLPIAPRRCPAAHRHRGRPPQSRSIVAASPATSRHCDDCSSAIRVSLEPDTGTHRPCTLRRAKDMSKRCGFCSTPARIPSENGLNDRTLIEMARERGHEQVAQMLERARDRPGRVVAQPADHPVHLAAERGDVNAVGALLDADPSLVDLGDRFGGTPLHRAVLGGQIGRRDRVARPTRRHPCAARLRGLAREWAHQSSSDRPGHLGRTATARASRDREVARLARSDLRPHHRDRVWRPGRRAADARRQSFPNQPRRVPNGKRPLSAAVEFGHDDIARLLLERGANPRWEPAEAVHAASSRGNLAMLKLLLEHGADPNEEIDSTSSPLAFAATPDIRALLESHGAGLGDYDTTWIEHDDGRLKSIAAEPQASFRDRRGVHDERRPARLARAPARRWPSHAGGPHDLPGVSDKSRRASDPARARHEPRPDELAAPDAAPSCLHCGTRRSAPPSCSTQAPR